MKQERKPLEAAATAGTEGTGTGTAPAPVAAKGPSRKRLVLGAVALLALAGAGYGGHYWWTTGRYMVSTDDAYVTADITLVSSRVQGYVKDLPAEANSHVDAGQVLMRLDDGDYRLALQSAESKVATMAQTLARIDAQVEAAQAAVAQAQAGQDAAQAQLVSANANLTRIEGLTDRKVVAQSQLDTATETQSTAAANLQKAKAAVASAEAQVAVLKAQKAEAEGQRHELELDVAQAKLDLDRTVLRAPVAGTITNIAVRQGDLVQPGVKLAALVPDTGLYIEANFKETQMQGIAPGATVELTFDALPGQSFETTVTSTAPATGSVFSLLPTDNATGNFTKVVQRVPVRIAIPPQALNTGALRAGLSAQVDVDSRTGAPQPRFAALTDGAEG